MHTCCLHGVSKCTCPAGRRFALTHLLPVRVTGSTSAAPAELICASLSLHRSPGDPGGSFAHLTNLLLAHMSSGLGQAEYIIAICAQLTGH